MSQALWDVSSSYTGCVFCQFHHFIAISVGQALWSSSWSYSHLTSTLLPRKQDCFVIVVLLLISVQMLTACYSKQNVCGITCTVKVNPPKWRLIYQEWMLHIHWYFTEYVQIEKEKPLGCRVNFHTACRMEIMEVLIHSFIQNLDLYSNWHITMSW